MDLNLANSMAAERGFIDWRGDDRAAALVNASDYMRRYRLRPTLTADEQTTVNLATLLIARDLLLNTAPALRASAAVKKTEKQLNTLKTSIEYFESSSDPYPTITAMLEPLAVRADGGPSYFSGIQSL